MSILNRLSLLVAMSATAAGPAGAQVIDRIPISGPSPVTAVLSADGRFLAARIVTGGVCGSQPWSGGGVAVYDTETGSAECVSLNQAGVPLVGSSGGASITADGNFVAFTSDSPYFEGPCGDPTALIPLSRRHIYVHNRRTRHTECITVTDAGEEANQSSEHEAWVSASGNLVVFSTFASNLVAGDSNAQRDIYAAPLVEGRRAGPFERLTIGVNGPGEPVTGAYSVEPRVSGDGRFVAFTSMRTDLVPGDTNAVFHVFRIDRQTREIVRVSLAQSTGQTSAGGYAPAISADGRYVSFTSGPHVAGGPSRAQIYRLDLQTGRVIVVTRAIGGGEATGTSSASAISGDGRIVVFASDARDLVPGDITAFTHVYAADLSTGAPRVVRLSVATDGSPAFGHSIAPALTSDGSLVVFNSGANLDPSRPLPPGSFFSQPLGLFRARIPPLVQGLLTGAGAGGPHVRTLALSGQGQQGREMFAYDPRFGGGVNVAYGDVTGDGVADIVTGPGPGGGPHVRVFDGARYAVDARGVTTPLVIADFFAYDPGFLGGVWVAVGDVTGDGIGEIITGAGAGGGPHVRVFQVRTAAFQPTSISGYASFFAYDPRFTGGVRVATGDLDGDEVSEILTAAGPGGGPHVQAFKLGAAAEPIQVLSFFAYDARFSGGVFVAAGDVDSDGTDEIITGADAGGGPHVRVLTVGIGFSFLREAFGFFAYDPGFSGGVRVAAGDLDGDGRAEIITAPGRGGAPLVRTFTGVAGRLSELSSFYAYDPAFRGGVFVAAPH